jgi:hypothetical protein
VTRLGVFLHLSQENPVHQLASRDGLQSEVEEHAAVRIAQRRQARDPVIEAQDGVEGRDPPPALPRRSRQQEEDHREKRAGKQ